MGKIDYLVKSSDALRTSLNISQIIKNIAVTSETFFLQICGEFAYVIGIAFSWEM